jgi:hypothetical protein
MKLELMLPRPTEEELNLGYKSEYFARLMDLGLDKKYKLTQHELTHWIHHNYTSVFLLNEELTLAQFKKLN